MSIPSPHHRHQTSLEGVIDAFATSPQFSPEQRDQATRIFNAIIEASEPLQHSKGSYKQITLVRLTYEYARSEASRDTFLRFFFQQTQIPGELTDLDLIRSCDYGPQLSAFADTLVENFFLPLKASTKKTPQPSPTTLSEIQSPHSLVGTSQRLATLRRDCLIRDRHRCVISRTFDDGEAMRRVARDGDEKARDEDGNFLYNEGGTFAPLEVAHIIPHSLTTVRSGMLELDESKKIALAILNMFDDGVVHLLDGVDIDRPRNAITLTHDLHQLFGNFEAYFEPRGQQQHTYQIDSIRTGILRHRIFPVDRTLFLTDTRTIDPPSRRLLAVHSAIAHILHLSAAGRHIDQILEQLDQKDVMADGSTELGCLTNLRLHEPSTPETDSPEYPELQGIMTQTETTPEPAEDGMMEWITYKYERLERFEIGSTNPSLMPLLFAEQSRAWGSYAQNHVTKVIREIYYFDHKVLQYCCNDDALCERLWDKLLEPLLPSYERALQQASFLVETERPGNLITMNHFFAENVRKAREARLKLQLEVLNSWQTEERSEQLLRLRDNLGVVMSNDDYTIQDLHDTLNSYYKVARKRFVDAICLQAVDHFLVSGKTSPLWIFSPYFIGKMSDGKLHQIAGDGDETVRRRNTLETELCSLRAGKKILEI